MNDQLKAALKGGGAGIDPAEMPKVVLKSEVISTLEQALTDARSGRLTSIALIGAAADGAIMTTFKGGQNGVLYVGVGIIDQQLLQEIVNPRANSRILRPGP